MSYHTLNREAIANTIGALGTAANLDFTNVIGNTNDLPVSSAVRDAIDEAISSVYKPKGSKTVAEMTSALLISSNKGNVYNMSTNGTTTSDFVEGAGKEINIGDNVVIVEVSQGVYKFDLLAGMVDLTNYYTRTDTDGLLNNKVDKVTGKQLSTEDYTTAEKTKLSGIETGAEVNIIEDVKVNGTSQQVTSKSVDLSIPSALSDLSDDSTHRVVTDAEKTTWNGKSVVTANPTTTSSDPDLSSLGINGTNYNIQGGSGGGHDYDVSMNANKDEMTLSEDNVAKTTLPLVAEYIGTRANWNNLSASQQAKYRRVTFLGEGGSNNYQLSHIGMVIHSTTLNSELLVQEIYGSDTHWVQHTGYFLRGATSGVVANQLQEDGGADTHTLTINEMPSHKHNFRSNGYGWESPDIPGALANLGGNNIALSPYNAYSGSTNSVTMLNTGGGQPHNNVPKYKNVYIWERVS